MAGLRKGHCYSGIRHGTSKRMKRAYTRKSKYKKHSFIKAVPTSKIVRYHLGDLKKKFPVEVNLITKQPTQVRHNSIESNRQLINRHLEKHLGKNYHFMIRTYPHHILRENKMIAGAGADRMQTGMQRAFGKPIGLAAQLKRGQAIFSVRVDKQDISKAETILKMAIHRMPGKYGLEVKKI